MRGRGGYLLVETIVAMAVLSITILGVHRSVQQALRARALTMDFTTARFLIENRLNEILMQPQVAEGQGQGSFPAPNDRFRYKWAITRIDVPLPEIPSDFPAENLEYIKKDFQSYMGRVEILITWNRGGATYERLGETLIGPAKLWQPPQQAPQP